MANKTLNFTLTLLFCCVIVSGCAGINRQHFYGLQVNYSNYDHGFVINSYDGQNVDFDFANHMNPNIEVWAQMDHDETIIFLKNNSRKEIMSDYFFDEFRAFRKDGRSIKLEKKQGKLAYQINSAKGKIGPGREAKFVLKTPAGLYYEDVAKIVCQLGVARGARLVLKPLPEMEISYE